MFAHSHLIPTFTAELLFFGITCIAPDTRSAVTPIFCLNSMIFFTSPSLFKAFTEQIMESHEQPSLPVRPFSSV